MAEPVKLWADRVLDIFDQPRIRFSVSCVGCRMGFGTEKGLLAHRSFCSSLSAEQKSEASAFRRTHLRQTRQHEARATTNDLRRVPLRDLAAERAREAAAERLIPVAHLTRPKTRGECEAVERPCPFVSCRYHLYLDVNDTGSIKLNFPDLEPDELVETCALDVAEAEGESREVCGELMNVTRERIRQLENRAVKRLHQRRFSLDLADYADFTTLNERGDDDT